MNCVLTARECLGRWLLVGWWCLCSRCKDCAVCCLYQTLTFWVCFHHPGRSWEIPWEIHAPWKCEALPVTWLLYGHCNDYTVSGGSWQLSVAISSNRGTKAETKNSRTFFFLLSVLSFLFPYFLFLVCMLYSSWCKKCLLKSKTSFHSWLTNTFNCLCHMMLRAQSLCCK